MYSDFESYGYDAAEHTHRQYSGKDKHTDKFLTITTWQSIYKNPPEYFEQFDFVLGDEAHQFKAKSAAKEVPSIPPSATDVWNFFTTYCYHNFF